MLTPGRKAYPGGMVLVFPGLPPARLGVFCPGDHVHLAVNFSAIVFSCLSQFPYSPCPGLFLASHYPVSVLLMKPNLAN